MPYGFRDKSTLVLPSGWDPTELANLRLRDGTTYQQVLNDLEIALTAVNREITNDPLWAGLCYFTDEPTVTYRVGDTGVMEIHTEYGQPIVQRASIEGHMLPLLPYDTALGWTRDYLKRANLEAISADIADAVRKVRDRFRLSVLTRLLQRGDDSGQAKGLGTSGYSPGFATAAANTNVDFTPPSVGGTTFDSNHEHYVAATGGWAASIFADIKDELREHGHEPPYDLIVSPADEQTIRGLSDFIPVAQWNVNYGATTSTAQLDPNADGNGNYYIGVLNDIRVRVVRGMPQYYSFAWRSYGPRSMRNPVRIRLETGETAFRAYAEVDPRTGGAYPLAYMMVRVDFGVGVGDRTNGTPRYCNNATWSDGTPT